MLTSFITVDDDAGHGVEVLVGRLAGLEEVVGVLRGAAQVRVVGVHGAAAEALHVLPGHQRGQRLVVEHLDLLDLARGAEAVEEVQEGDLALDRREVR